MRHCYANYTVHQYTIISFVIVRTTFLKLNQNTIRFLNILYIYVVILLYTNVLNKQSIETVLVFERIRAFNQILHLLLATVTKNIHIFTLTEFAPKTFASSYLHIKVIKWVSKLEEYDVYVRHLNFATNYNM